ncbi:MAG: trypsin-like peptidase domain-containing protein [Candidatus Paceibacterota bacterium]|jgi:serine protease Do
MPEGTQSNIVNILKKAVPAVVSIMPEGKKRNPLRTKKIEGGSGFIIDDTGTILTNLHVVMEKTQQYTVITNDGGKYEARILSRNKENDIAILKIENQIPFPFIPLGDSSSLELGQEVFAIGDALGFEDTVSQGIISGLTRKVETMRNLIQTDAAINPGNSGGPLINNNGEAIGINSIMVTDAENIGFAIPINEAKEDLEDIKKYGRVRYPFLGFNYIDQEEGALIVDVDELCQNELKEKDVVLECNGKKIGENLQLEDCLNELNVGETVKFTVLRNDEVLEFSLTVKEKN